MTGPTTPGPSAAYFKFNTDATGVIANTARFFVETYFDGDSVSFPFPSLVLDKFYKMRLVKTIKQTAVYVDDGSGFVLLGQSSNSGTIAGEFIGLWRFNATADFKNLKSWSALIPPP